MTLATRRRLRLLERKWAMQDKQRGYVVYHGTRPAYRTVKRNVWEDVATLGLLAFVVVMIQFL